MSAKFFDFFYEKLKMRFHGKEGVGGSIPFIGSM